MKLNTIRKQTAALMIGMALVALLAGCKNDTEDNRPKSHAPSISSLYGTEQAYEMRFAPGAPAPWDSWRGLVIVTLEPPAADVPNLVARLQIASGFDEEFEEVAGTWQYQPNGDLSVFSPLLNVGARLVVSYETVATDEYEPTLGGSGTWAGFGLGVAAGLDESGTILLVHPDDAGPVDDGEGTDEPDALPDLETGFGILEDGRVVRMRASREDLFLMGLALETR